MNTNATAKFPRQTGVVRGACLLPLLLFSISLIHGQERENVPRIEPGKPTESELEGEQRHEYIIAVPPGHYLNLTVTQLGIDVVLTVYRNGREKVIDVDKANGTRGRERLSLMLDTTSNYQLQVSAREKKPAGGRYVLEITDTHPVIAQDEIRWSAEQSFAQAKQLLRQDAAGALAQAIQKYRASRQLWRTVNDAEGESTALLNLANAYFTAGKIEQALEHYNEAEAAFQSLNDPFNTALTVLYIGMCKVALGDIEAAFNQYNQALHLFTTLDDQKYLAFALNELGRAHYLQGHAPEARDYFLRAIEIRRVVDDRKGLAYSLNVLGRVLFYYFGDDEQAITYYKQALELQREDYRQAAQTLDDIGRIYFASGKHDDALEHYNKALRLQRNTSDIIGEAETLSYIGMVYAASGRYEEALRDYYQVALEIQQSSHDRVGEGHTLHQMGMAYLSLRAYEKALDHLNAALKIWKDSLYRTAEADTRYGIARVEMKRGDFMEARRQIEEALPTVELLRTKIANQYLRISYFASVQDYYELYVDVLMQMHKKSPSDGFDKIALSVNERARGRALLDTLIEAQSDVSRGVDAGLLKQQQKLQRELTSLSQQRMLRDGQSAEQAAAARERLASLLSEYHKVEEQILQRSPAYAALTQPSALSVEDMQTKLLDPGTVLLEYALGDERSYLWVVTPSSSTRYELPKRADIENTVKQLRELVTARNKPVPGQRVAQARAREERADAKAWETAATLSEMLALAKVTAETGAQRLVIVSDGELQYVPFSMLPVPRKPELETKPVSESSSAGNGPVSLVNYYEVVMLPSMAVLSELRRKRPAFATAQKTVFVVADPVFDKNDERVKGLAVSAASAKASSLLAAATRQATIRDSSGRIARLPFTLREANSIVALLPPSNTTEAVGFKANRAIINSGLLAQYRILHFATHGLTNDEYPELSGLLLSMIDEKGEAQDGFLQLHEIYNLNLPVEMVVLSACETGLGRKVRGEGLIGLTRGFMYAGAKRVVASLWQVNDPYTSKLMKDFYQAMLKDGMAPAAALRAAQLKMLARTGRQAPYYWAAFVLHGEWQNKP